LVTCILVGRGGPSLGSETEAGNDLVLRTHKKRREDAKRVVLLMKRKPVLRGVGDSEGKVGIHRKECKCLGGRARKRILRKGGGSLLL